MKNMQKMFSSGVSLVSMVGITVLVFGALLAPLAKVEAIDYLPVAVAITASPSTICTGGSTVLNWDSVDATSVSINQGIGNVDQTGKMTVHPTSTTTYIVTGSNSSGATATADVLVTVNSSGSPSCGGGGGGSAPTVSLSADDTSIDEGDSTRLEWDSDNATSCTASGAWSGSKALSGSQSTGDLNSDKTYVIVCRNSDGDTATDSVTIRVNNDNNDDDGDVSVSISADDTSISFNDDTNVRWTSKNADSCKASAGTNGWSGSKSRSGNFDTGALKATVTFRIECKNGSDTDEDSVTVKVGTGSTPTQNDDRPTVATDNATNLTGYSATLNGRVNGNGLPTTAWFNYGTTTNFGLNTSPVSYGSGFTNFSAPIFGLVPNTTYYFRAAAQNAEGIAYGNTLAFSTSTVGGTTIITTTRRSNNSNSLVLINSSIDRSQPILPTLDNSRPKPGDEILYTVNYQNIGNAAITNLVLRLDLPNEVDYMFSNPANPSISGNTLIFSLGSLRANGQGTVTVRVRVRDNIPDGTDLDFPATLSYTDPNGNPQSVSANVSAEVFNNSLFGANALFGAGSFLPGNIFGWLLLIILLVILVLLARYLLFPPDREIHTTTIEH